MNNLMTGKARNGMRLDRALGTMWGVACGDALGARVEFMSAQQIHETFPSDPSLVGCMRGECTDDTGLSLALARGLLQWQPGALQSMEESVGREFIQWLARGVRGVGFTCSSAISTARDLLRDGYSPLSAWRDAATITQQIALQPTEGNGALMRCAFVGLYAATVKQAEWLAREQAKMTHLGPDNLEACAWYAGTIWALVRSKHPRRTWHRRLRVLPEQFRPTAVPSEPGGTAVDTLRAVVYLVSHSVSLDYAVLSAVRLGGDADTVAALVGGVAGAMSGARSVPLSWLIKLDPEIKEEIPRLVYQLF